MGSLHRCLWAGGVYFGECWRYVDRAEAESPLEAPSEAQGGRGSGEGPEEGGEVREPVPGQLPREVGQVEGLQTGLAHCPEAQRPPSALVGFGCRAWDGACWRRPFEE